MTPELKAAAEIYRIYKADPTQPIGKTWKHGDFTFGACTVMAAMVTLADAYLAEADDTRADQCES